jgi:hypothetical protein
VNTEALKAELRLKSTEGDGKLVCVPLLVTEKVDVPGQSHNNWFESDPLLRCWKC